MIDVVRALLTPVFSADKAEHPLASGVKVAAIEVFPDLADPCQGKFTSATHPAVYRAQPPAHSLLFLLCCPPVKMHEYILCLYVCLLYQINDR